jgi:hypothetical protein
MTLHVYSPEREHDHAFVVGTRADLVRLRDAIDSALGAQDRHCSSDAVDSFFDASGAGYDVYVKVIPASVENNLVLPYAELTAHGPDRDGWTPDLVPTE